VNIIPAIKQTILIRLTAFSAIAHYIVLETAAGANLFITMALKTAQIA
jgi:hypothetical protein